MIVLRKNCTNIYAGYLRAKQFDEKLKWGNNGFSRICLYPCNTDDNETAYTTHNDDSSPYRRYDAGFLHKLYS